MDVRLRNRSQLAGFAKRDDLKYFLNELLEIEYVHNERLAPSEELLDEWRDDSITWEEFEEKFEELMKERAVEETISKKSFETKTVLLCSEHKPQYCHRRLIIEYLKNEWGNVESSHLIE